MDDFLAFLASRQKQLRNKANPSKGVSEMRQRKEEANMAAVSWFHFPSLWEDVGCDHSETKIAKSQDKQADGR